MPITPIQRLLRHFVAAAAAISLTTMLSACAGDDAAAPDASAPIVVGSDLTAPPYASLEAGNPVGLDPEMVNALAGELGRRVVIKDIRFEQLIPSLKSGQIDVIASALYITSERAKIVSYIPYFSTGNSIMVRAGSAPIADVTGLCGLKVAVIKGGDVANQLRSKASAQCRAAGQAAIDVREFPTDPEATQALISGQVDSHVTDAAICGAIKDKTQGKVVISSTDLLYPVPVGMAVRKDDVSLRNDLAKALDVLVRNGAYERLLTKYNVKPVDQQQVSAVLDNG